jgi:hypothetical protein
VTGQVGQYLLHEDGSETLLIHFAHNRPDDLMSQVPRLRRVDTPYRIACVPNLISAAATPTRSWPYQRSDDPRAVTCPVCQSHPEYKRVMALLGVMV